MGFQLACDESWTEAQARRLARSLSAGQHQSRAPAFAGQSSAPTGGSSAPAGERSAPAGQRSGAESCHDVLTRTMQDEVIPRLFRARRQPAGVRAAAQAAGPGHEQVSHLVGLLLGSRPAEPNAYVEALHGSGTPVEALFLDLLAPAARRLGDMWEDDTCTFSDVTMGMLRLGSVLRLMGIAFDVDSARQASAPGALLAQMPGEQHGFGLAMVAQFFRRAGWNVRQEPMLTSAELVDLVRAQWFGVVGISVACSDRLESLAADIRAIRRQSRNRAVGVMVGGPPFVAHPQLAAMVGADATAVDGRQAVRAAQSLISQLAETR